MPNAKTGPKSNRELPDTMSANSPSLKDLGISEQESSRAQALAAIPEADLDVAIEAVKATGGELTTKWFVDLGRSHRAKEDGEPAPAPPRDRPDVDMAGIRDPAAGCRVIQ